jgi:hypothetical protein
MAGSLKNATPSADHSTGGRSGEFGNLMRAIKTLVDPYRPELHYMRGPGPKWHAKHDHDTAEHDVVPGLVRVKG